MNLFHARLLIDNVERSCDALIDLTVSGGRGSRMAGRSDPAVCAFTLWCELGDVPYLGEVVVVEMLAPRTRDDYYPGSIDYGVPVFIGTISDVTVQLDPTPWVRAAVNAVDVSAMVQSIPLPASTTTLIQNPSPLQVNISMSASDLRDEIAPADPYLLGSTYDRNVDTVLPRGTDATIGEPEEVETLQDWIDSVCTTRGWVSYYSPARTERFNPLPAGQNRESRFRWHPTDYSGQPRGHVVLADDISGDGSTSRYEDYIGRVECSFISTDPPPSVAVNGSDYWSVVKVVFGPEPAQGERTYAIKERQRAAKSIKRTEQTIETRLTDRADAQAMADAWAITAQYPAPVWSVTAVFTTAVLDEAADGDARRDMAVDMLAAVCRGPAQVAVPVDVGLMGTPGVYERMFIESTKISYLPDGWLIDFELSHGDSYDPSTQAYFPGRDHAIIDPTPFVRIKAPVPVPGGTTTPGGGTGTPQAPGSPHVAPGTPTDTTVPVTITPPINPGTSPSTIRYDVRYSSDNEQTWTEVDVGADLTPTVTGLTPSTAYMFQVRATSDDGVGGWSLLSIGATTLGASSSASGPWTYRVARVYTEYGDPGVMHASLDAYQFATEDADGAPFGDPTGVKSITIDSPSLGVQTDDIASTRLQAGEWLLFSVGTPVAVVSAETVTITLAF